MSNLDMLWLYLGGVLIFLLLFGFFFVVHRIEGIIKGRIRRKTPIEIRKKLIKLFISICVLITSLGIAYLFDNPFGGREFLNSSLALLILLIVVFLFAGSLIAILYYGWNLVVDIADSLIQKKRPGIFYTVAEKKFYEYDAEREADLLRRLALYRILTPFIGMGVTLLVSYIIIWRRQGAFPNEYYLLIGGVSFLLVSCLIIYVLRRHINVE